jgi:hypothetical protein
MGRQDFHEQNQLLQQAAKTVNKFESEQVQLRVIDALITTLQVPDPDLEAGPGWSPQDDNPDPEPGVDAVAVTPPVS